MIHHDIHDIHGIYCPCRPKFFKLCDEEVDGDDTCPGCWKCVDGLIEINLSGAELAEDSIIIVHNEVIPVNNQD